MWMGEQMKASVQSGRDEAAAELEVYADACRRTSAAVADLMTDCANRSNLSTVETYKQAANIARAGSGYRNMNCENCRDTRGGPKEHATEDCTWSPPAGLFDEREQCQGMIQVGWMGRYGVVPGGMDNDPVPGWRPIYMEREVGQAITDEINADPDEVDRLTRSRQQARAGKRTPLSSLEEQG